METLVYDIPIEVTQKQYSTAMNLCAGLVCGRIDNGKYYIKPWFELKYVTEVLIKSAN